MCTNPILIRNRKYKHIKVNMPNSFLKVPCGVCDECLQQRANSLYVRARMEFDDCLKSGGCGFMCCLTYSDKEVPTIVIDENREMVFNKKHVIDFIKRLRINLERKYQNHFKCSAPKFKYLVTSEFGTDETKTHRPHYHLLFFFKDNVSFTIFKSSFKESTYYRKGDKFFRYFGYILQCDLLDPKQGGIKYSGKYILKDLMYEKQRCYIQKHIKFAKDYVNNKYNLIPCPRNDEQEFYNKCIRSRKDYRKDVAMYVGRWRNMLQFYLVSNDLGISHIIDKYGDSLIHSPFINFEGFPFSVPKLVKQRISQSYGYKKSNELSKQIFVNYCSKMFDDLKLQGFDKDKASDLLDFAKTFVQPRYGSLYLYNPFAIDFEEMLLKTDNLIPWDWFIDNMKFFDDNDFYSMREQLLRAISLYDSPQNRNYRASLAHERREKQIEQYNKKKRNKYGI